MGFLKGKRALILGVVSERSIAFGIAKALHAQGAEMAFTYQSDKIKSRVEDIAAQFNVKQVYPCDVAKDSEITSLMSALKKDWSHFDIMIHSIAFAPTDQITGDFVENVTREGFHIAHDISAYSLVALAKAAQPLMTETGSILTLSYYGAQKAVPHYNVMGIAKASLEASVRYLAASLGPKGIRVNAISAGPIKTLAASGIKGLRSMLDAYAKSTPLRRNVTIDEVGQAAAFLCSDLASGITADVLYVDAGYHAVSMMDINE